ncbi:hypothetical protein MPSEU_000139300 [Mayamaea pseudoterrestris]|nr:hypothetical protein MPSEU_000139300 [Mayamaea pseudoterrestris]
MSFFPTPFTQLPLFWNGYTVMYMNNLGWTGQFPLLNSAIFNGVSMQNCFPPPQLPLHSTTTAMNKNMTLPDILKLANDHKSHEVGDGLDDSDPFMTTPILEPPLLVPPTLFLSSISRDIIHPISSDSSVTTEASTSSTMDTGSSKKRPHNGDDTVTSHRPRFRKYQTDKWTWFFESFVAYKNKDASYKNDAALVRWAKQQRYHYQRFLRNKPSFMTADRVEALESIGFCWDVRKDTWLEHLQELKQYQKEHGHCYVPTLYPNNPALAIWCKAQRRQHTLYMQGKPGHITAERMAQLDQLGFVYMRKCRKQRLLFKTIEQGVRVRTSLARTLRP